MTIKKQFNETVQISIEMTKDDDVCFADVDVDPNLKFKVSINGIRVNFEYKLYYYRKDIDGWTGLTGEPQFHELIKKEFAEEIAEFDATPAA